MLSPHSYTLDSHSKSESLAAEILAASTPPQISAVCSSLTSYLRHLSPNHSIRFFSLTFPTLIAKLFGFDSSSTSTNATSTTSSSWIETLHTAKDADAAGSVFSLLSPDGVLMSLMSAVDRASLIKYFFPTERLPEWVRYMLNWSSDQIRKIVPVGELCVLFRDRVKDEQVQLNVFEYYIFWFAYYPVCRGSNEKVRSASVEKVRKFRLENWTNSLPVFTRRVAESKSDCNLYLWLLYAYLRKFVPAYDLNVQHHQQQPYRSSIRHYPSNYDASIMMQAEFVVSTFVNFWLVDNDFSPLPVSVCNAFGVGFPLRSVLGETPPVSGLGELVKLFVKYVNLSLIVSKEGYDQAEYLESPRWNGLSPASFDSVKHREIAIVHGGMTAATSFNVMIQRPLYRFILRTFLFCPVEASIKNVSEVFSVWITYMEPWTISSEEFAEFDALLDGSLKNNKAEDKCSVASPGYSSAWKDYVLSNYLFYSSLAMHFIGFAHKFLHADPEAIVQMMLKVLNSLTATRELMELIKNMDTTYHCKAIGSGKSMLSSLYRYVPSIREQLQDWEDGLCESDADGSFLHENWNKDLRLFSNDEDGGQQLLQLFVLRAEYELQAISGDGQSSALECIDSLKSQISCMFGSQIMSPRCVTREGKDTTSDRHELFKPRKDGNATVSGVRYKGDWMRRPASGDEVAWLANLLVQISDWLNENLGLNRAHQTTAKPCSSVNISDVAEKNVYGITETVKVLVLSVGSWLMMLGFGVVELMRKRGIRINLRLLASKKVLVVLFAMFLLTALKRSLSRA